MPNGTMASVVAVLGMLEKKLGSFNFRRKFQIIIADNGSEFQDWEGMTRAVTGEGERTSPGLRRPTHWKYSGGEMNTRTASSVGGVPGGWYWSLPRGQGLRGWIAFVNNAQKQF